MKTMTRQTGRLCCLLAAVLLLATAGSLSAADPGSVGFSFLKVSWGARNAGMGDVGVALPSGLWGSYHNPASLGAAETAVGFMHQEYIFDTRREYIAGSMPLLDGGMAIGLDFFKVPDIEYREGATEEPIGYFDAQDVVVFAGYGREVVDNIWLGVVGKYASEKIESETADAVNLDLGGIWRLHRKVAIGVAVKNVGEKPRFRSEQVDLPLTVAGGVAVEFDKTIVGADVVLPKESDARVNLGAERQLTDFLALRAGYKIGYDEEDLAFGIGFAKNIWRVDYAFVPYKSGLGTSHRFALTVAWR